MGNDSPEHQEPTVEESEAPHGAASVKDGAAAGAVPAVIARLGKDAARPPGSFVKFFVASIRNANTRAAYLRSTSLFLTRVEKRGLELAALQPFHVSGYVEKVLMPHYAKTTVKQHLAAIRMLCNFLVVRQVIPRSPAEDASGSWHPAHRRPIAATGPMPNRLLSAS